MYRSIAASAASIAVIALAALFGLLAVTASAYAVRTSGSRRAPGDAGWAIVLMYHHIDPNPDPLSQNTITPEQFEEHMEYLAACDLSPISISQLCCALDGECDIPPGSVAITFDDGYESFYKYAYPVLKKLKLPATVFVITSSVGIVPPEGEIPHFGWDEMLEMYSSDLVEFGSHAYRAHCYIQGNSGGQTGPALTTRQYNASLGRIESDSEYIDRIKDDLSMSQLLLKTVLGKPVTTLAFPYGAYNSEVIQAAENAGFRYLFTTKPGGISNGSNRAQLMRINAGCAGSTLHSLKQTKEHQARRFQPVLPAPQPLN